MRKTIVPWAWSGSYKLIRSRSPERAGPALLRLKQVAKDGGNLFAEMLTTVRHASLGQITQALYEVGGRYRRNM